MTQNVHQKQRFRAQRTAANLRERSEFTGQALSPVNPRRGLSGFTGWGRPAINEGVFFYEKPAWMALIIY